MAKLNKIMSFALALTLTAGVAAGTVVTGADYEEPVVAEADEESIFDSAISIQPMELISIGFKSTDIGKTLYYKATVSGSGTITVRASADNFIKFRFLDSYGNTSDSVFFDSDSKFHVMSAGDYYFEFVPYGPNPSVCYITNFYYTFTPDTVSSIKVSTLPTKTAYKAGEALDLKGGKLTLTYNNGLTEVIDLTSTDVSVTGFDSETNGTKTLTVYYGNLTTTFNVTVSGAVAKIQSIQVLTAPTKKSYKVGEPLSVAGGVIKATYNDGTTKMLDITPAMCSGFDSTTEGKKTVTVTYEGKQTTFDVTVRNSAIEDEGTVIEVGEGGECTDLSAALKEINAAVKKRTADTAYTLVLTDDTYTETKALTLPALKVIIKGDEGTNITVPSITAKGDLALENITAKTKKGAAAAVTAKKSLTVAGCALGAAKVTASLNAADSTFDALTVSGKAGTSTELGGKIVISKALSVNNDFIADDGADITVNGKFTAKGAISFGAIKAFNVNNGK